MAARSLATLLLIAASNGLLPAQAGHPTGRAENVASLALRDLEGRDQSLEEYRGRIVLLNFWATWCLPCREEMPVFIQIQNGYAQRGVQVIAASTDEPTKKREVARFARRLKLNFPVWVGATTQEIQRLGLGEAIPATAIIDRDGRIAGRILGVVSRADLERRIEWLLGDRLAEPPPPVTDTTAEHDHQHEGHQAAGGHGHEGEEDHEHGGVGMEGASLVPS